MPAKAREHPYAGFNFRVEIDGIGGASFAEVWTGPGYAMIRRMMHPPALPMCRRCDDFLDENRALLAIYTSA